MKNEPGNQVGERSNSHSAVKQRTWTLPESYLDASVIEDLQSSYGAFESAKEHDRELIGYSPPDHLD